MINVPNTSTFSLQNVYDSVNSHTSTTGNLVSCFSDSISGLFDPTYDQVSYAPTNSLLRFRNYGYRPEFVGIRIGVANVEDFAVITEESNVVTPTTKSYDVGGVIDFSRLTGYDKFNKVMVGLSFYSGAFRQYIYVLDLSDPLLTNKPLSFHDPSCVIFSDTDNILVDGYWNVGISSTYDFFYKTDVPYSSFTTAPTLTGCTTTPVTQIGEVSDIIEYNNDFFYLTYHNEIFYMTSMGAATSLQILDLLDSKSLSDASAANDQLIAYVTTSELHRLVISEIPNLSSWASFSIDTNGDFFTQVRMNRTYNTTYGVEYALAVTDSFNLFVIDHKSGDTTPIITDITPNHTPLVHFYSIYSVAIADDYIYAGAVNRTTGDNVILKYTSNPPTFANISVYHSLGSDNRFDLLWVY